MADEIADIEERHDAIAGVRKALAAVCQSELDWALAERLMAPERRQVAGETVEAGPVSYYAIARRHRMTVDDVVEAEDHLKVRLREALGGLG